MDIVGSMQRILIGLWAHRCMLLLSDLDEKYHMEGWLGLVYIYHMEGPWVYAMAITFDCNVYTGIHGYGMNRALSTY